MSAPTSRVTVRGWRAGRRDSQNRSPTQTEGDLIQDRDNAEQRHSTPKSDQRAQDQNGVQRAHDGSSFSAQQLFRLQRAAGNRATTAAIGRAAQQQVQRVVEDDVESGVEKGGGGLDFTGGQVGHWAGGGAFGSMPTSPGSSHSDLAYKYGNTTTGGAGGQIGGSIAGGIGGVGSTVMSSIQAEKARKKISHEVERGREGQATHREAHRQQKSSVTNAVSSGIGVGGAGVSTAGSVSQVMANAGSTSAFAGLNNLLGGIAGIIALPIQALSTGRTVRKAAKQWKRVTELRKVVTDPEGDAAKAKEALQAHKDTIPALEATLQGAEEDLADLRQERSDLRTRKKGHSTQSKIDRIQVRIDLLQVDIDQAKQIAKDARDAVDEARAEEARLDAARVAAEQAVKDSKKRVEDEKEGPDEIAAYALAKQKSGVFKKVVSAVGGFLGIGGGIAATVASFAAIGATGVVGTAVIATPVGWALCGAAALVALAVGSWQFWKWASKRYGRAKKEGMSKGKAFLTAINPFKKVGESRRERLAASLWEFAKNGTPAEKTKARDTIKALGLDYDALHMERTRHKAASIKLIHDKMGS